MGHSIQAESPVPPPSLLRLHELTLEASEGHEAFFSWLVTLPAMPHLTFLKVGGSFDDGHDEAMKMFFQRSGGTLESLHLTYTVGWSLEGVSLSMPVVKLLVERDSRHENPLPRDVAIHYHQAPKLLLPLRFFRSHRCYPTASPSLKLKDHRRDSAQIWADLLE